jgi:hypothetical protein
LLEGSTVRQRELPCKLGERDEDETSLRQRWVWNGEVGFADHEIIDEEKVEIDRARPVSRPAGRASELCFDSLACSEEVARGECGFDLDDRVVKVTLVWNLTDRLRLVDARSLDHFEAFEPVEQLNGGLQIRKTVTLVGAESEVRGAQRETSTETSSTATGSGGSGLVARTTTPEAPKRSTSVSATAVQSRSSVLYERSVAMYVTVSQTAP